MELEIEGASKMRVPIQRNGAFAIDEAVHEVILARSRGGEMADSTDNEEFIDIDPKDLDRMLDVKIQLQLARSTSCQSGRSHQYGPGSVSSFLSPLMSLDIRVNDQLVARGEAVVIGERYGIRVTEVISPNERLKSSAW